MTARDLFADLPTAAEKPAAECCGTCKHAVLRPRGTVKCSQPSPNPLFKHSFWSPMRDCQFTPSRYLAADFIEREARLVISAVSLEGRRQIIETFDGLYGKEAGEKLRERVKELWASLKAEEQKAERKW